MADYAGAVAAIKARLAAGWTTTPIAQQNEAPPQSPWPPVDGDGRQTSWVYLEVVANDSRLRAAGLPGSQLWLTEGHILVHIFVPLLAGTDLAHGYAVTIGEIFRAKAFYRDEAAGAEVRTWAPRADGGTMDPENGNYFRVTCTVPFEFYYRG